MLIFYTERAAVHSGFLTKCKTACIFRAPDVLYILFRLGTLTIRNTGGGGGGGEGFTSTLMPFNA